MDQLTRIKVGDVLWEVRAEFAAALFDDGGLRLSHWLAAGRAQPVKQGPHREVYRIELPEGSFFLKHYKAPDLSAVAGNLFRVSKARREWDACRKIAQKAIATVTPVALGERRRAGVVLDAFLITEAIDDAPPLNEYLKSVVPALRAEVQRRVRRDLTLQVADLTAAMHDAGIRHDDFHAANLLVRTVEGRPQQLYLVDLHAAGVGRRLGWRRARKSLVLLNGSLLLRTSSADRCRFLWRYLDRRPGLVKNRKSAALQLVRLTRRLRNAFLRRRERRCLYSNRHYRRRAIGRTRGFATRQLSEQAMANLLRDPEAFLSAPTAVTLKDSPLSRVVRVDIAGLSPPGPCAVKKNMSKGPWHDLRRTSPGRRAWKAAHALLLRKIPTPDPLALVERGGPGLTRTSYLVTRWVPGGVTLYDYARRVLPSMAPGARQAVTRELIRRIATLVRRLHQHNFDQRDLKSVNFVVAIPPHAGPNGDGASGIAHAHVDDAAQHRPSAAPPLPDVYLLDLEGLKRWRRLPWPRRAQNLARLHVSFHQSPLVTRTDKLRFLRCYLGGSLRGSHDWKSLWRRIEHRTARKIEQNRARGCVIT